MTKLRLDVERLRVDSFATAPAEQEERGTVRGHQVTQVRTQCLCPPPATLTNCPVGC